MKKTLLTIVFCVIGSFQLIFAQVSEKETIARQWIKANFKELKNNSDADLNLRFVRKSKSGETLRFQQMVNNIPVFNTEIVVHFNLLGEVSYFDYNVNHNITQINTIPQISKETATNIADNVLKYSGAVTFQETKLFVLAVANETKLVYRVVTSAEDLSGSWETFIDANTGSIISNKDIAIYCGSSCSESHKHDVKSETKSIKHFMKHDTEKVSTLAYETGTAMVFLSDPLSSARVAYAGNYVDGNDSDTAELNAQRVLVNLPQVVIRQEHIN